MKGWFKNEICFEITLSHKASHSARVTLKSPLLSLFSSSTTSYPRIPS